MDTLTKTQQTNLHPCPACGLNAPRTVDAAHRLCDGCAADLPATLAHINDVLTRIVTGRDDHQAAWTAYQADLPAELAERWMALCAARNAAEGAVIAYERGRLSTALSDAVRRERLAEAYQRLARVQHKIERTRVASPEIAMLLDKESKYRAELDRLTREMERWSRAKQETQWAIDGDRPF